MPDSALAAAQVLAAQCLGQGRYQEAIQALERVSGPLDADTANLAGVCHTLAGQFAQAMRCYADALRADPAHADACLNAGLTGFLQGSGESSRMFHRWLALRNAARRAGAVQADARPRLPQVTLACADCAYHDLAAAALRASLAACEFGAAIFLSDRDCGVPGVRHVPIEPIRSSAEYSNFMLRRLLDHVATDFALVIQYDGFALNADAWDAGFLEYDYIGAPMVVGGKLVVGNGGFSLRSRRLLEALRRDAQIRAFDARRGTFEDAAICGIFRRRLEQEHGIRFAPPEVADRFAAGRTLPVRASFGFHGLVHLVRLHEEDFRLRETAGDGIEVVFRARSPLGAIAAQRELEVSGPAAIWAPAQA